MSNDTWQLGGRTLASRLIVGTGKYASFDETRAALAASGAEIVTVALRRVDLSSGAPTVLDAIDRKRYVLLPNTAGCYTADEAVRTLRLARELGMDELVKLEVIGDAKTRCSPTTPRRSRRRSDSSPRASRCCRTARTTSSRASGCRTSAASR